MRVLPLYDDLPRTPLEESERLARDPGCTRCELHRGVKTVCVPPAGSPGGLLVVGEGPGRSEDLASQPFVGKSGQYLRDRLKRHWSGPVAVANSTSCYPGRTSARAEVTVDVRHVDACRPYLAHVLAEAKPRRVVCVGAHAARAVTGRAVPPTKTRRGYAYLFWARLPDALRELAEAEGVSGGEFEAEQLFVRAGEVERDRKCAPADWQVALEAAVPVFFLLHPAAALRNRFMRQAFEDDLEWALTCPDPPKPPVTASFAVVESAEDDRARALQLRASELTAFDVEAGGVAYTPSYRVVSFAAAPVGEVELNRAAPVAYVWPTGAPAEGLAAWLADPACEKTGANVQYDVNAERQRGRVVRGVTSDVRLRRKLLEPHASGALDDMADLVGLGGYKKPSEGVADRVALQITNGLKEERLRAKHAEEVARGKYRKPPKRPPEKQPELEAWVAFREADPEMAAVVAADPSWGARWGWVYAAMARLESETLWRYNAKDAVVTALVGPVLAERLLAAPALDTTWRPFLDEMPEVVAQIEAWGIAANVDQVRAFDAYLQSKIAPVEARLATYESVENWKSVPQKVRLLYDELGLKSTKKTKSGGRSVDASTLKGLVGQHPVVDDMLLHSKYTDLKKSFACGLDGNSGMLQYIRHDGRMHPSILIDGAECMPAGELVLTTRGYVPVERVEVGDVVLSHEGRPQPVTATSRFSPAVIRHVVLANGLHLRTTLNHGYLTRSGWVLARDLRVGDGVAVHALAGERWRPIDGWAYEVSSWGRVRSAAGRCLRLQRKERWGHLKVALSRGGVKQRGPDYRDFAVHRLVHQAFNGPPPSESEAETRHVNGLAWDNRPENLVWGSAKANREDARLHGTMSHRRGHAQVKLTEEAVEIIRATPRSVANDRMMAERFGVCRETVGQVRGGERWRPEDHVVGKRVTFDESTVLLIEDLPAEVTYGLTVAQDASHVTGGIVTHNTGRASSSSPNLFNPPGKKFKVEGAMMRDIFVAPRGSLIVSCDWSQIQLRLAAHLSGDEAMKEIFASGVDFHKRTAELIAPIVWGIRPEDVTEEHRAHAKNFNFGLLFGMGDHALACRMFDTQAPTKEQTAMASKIRAAVLGEFRGLARWIERMKDEARRTGVVVSQMDGRPARYRQVWDIADADEGRRGHAEREVVNSPIQAEEAAMMHRSTIAVVKWLWQTGLAGPVKVLLPLYDQLLMEVRRDLVDEVCDVVPAIMTSWPCSVPVVADVEVGRAWGSLRKMKLGPDGWLCHVRDGAYSVPSPSALEAFDEAERQASP